MEKLKTVQVIPDRWEKEDPTPRPFRWGLRNKKTGEEILKLGCGSGGGVWNSPDAEYDIEMSDDIEFYMINPPPVHLDIALIARRDK